MFKSKKKLIAIIVVLVILVSCAVAFFIKNGNYENMHLEGYSLMIPQKWEAKEEPGRLTFFEDGEKVGQFDLLYSDYEVADIPAALGFEPENPQVRESDKYVTKVYEISYAVGEDKIRQYVFDGLPDCPPYQAVLTLHNIGVKMADKMLKSVTLPKLGTHLPEKPLGELTETFLEQAVYTTERGTSVYAYHLSRLDRLIRAGAEQPADKASFLHILSCKVDAEGLTVANWYYLSVGNGEKRLYTYEKGVDGTYFYRNQYKLIKKLTREVSREENYTRYYADDILILEAPYNPYAENKDALFAYKDTVIGDNSNVSSLVQTAIPTETVLEGVGLSTEAEPYGLTLRYVLNKPDLYIHDGKLDESAFYQNALVLFSLVSNVDWIQMEIRTGETVYTVKYERKVAEAQFEEQDLRQFATDEKAFEKFTEDVPKMAPPSGSGADGTRIVTSVTVTISSGMQVKHPVTGYMVYVKPYAERFGVTQYLDKPITVTLYEKVEAGKTTMWAEGTCGGALIGSYPISSRAEFDRLVALAG